MLVPLPGLDVAVDVGVLVSMMNAVNRAFCLSPDQIERLGMGGARGGLRGSFGRRRRDGRANP